MHPLGSNDDEIQPNPGTSAAEFGDTQHVDYDSQNSPISGNGVFDYTFPVEEDIDDMLETQEVDYDCEAEVVNPWEETQVVADSEDETEMGYDGLFCQKNVETQSISGTEPEGDNASIDGEDSDRTEVLSDCDEGSKSLPSPPQANGICNAGSCKRDFTSVRAASLRASGIAARYKTNFLKGLYDVDNSYGVIGDQSSEQREGTTEMKKSKGSSLISRRLFTEDLDAKENEHCDNEDLAGLNSEGPGESCQAGNLNCVDRLLKANVFEYEQDAKHGNPGGDKLDPAFSGKGAQTLAKKVYNRRLLAESGPYDFNYSLEDEGGGEFFVKWKDVLISSSSRDQKSLSKTMKPRENVHGSQMDVTDSEPNLSKTTTSKMNRGASGISMKRNLNSSMEGEAANDEKEGCENKMKEAATRRVRVPKRSLSSGSKFDKKSKRSKRPGDQFIEGSKFSVASRTRSKKDAINIVEAKADEQEKNRINTSPLRGLDNRRVSYRLQKNKREKRDDGTGTSKGKHLTDNGSVPTMGLHTGDEQNEFSPVVSRKGKVITPVCGSDYKADEVRENKRRKNGPSVPIEKKAVELNSGGNDVPHGMATGEAVIEDEAQVRVSNSSEGVNGGSSAVVIIDQTVTRGPCKRKTRGTELAKDAKHYASAAESSFKLQATPSPAGENDQCSSLSSKIIKTKHPPKGSPVKTTIKSSDVAVTTPVNCKTPTESVSPVCAGDEYYKQSYAQNSARPFLLKELNQFTPFIPKCKLSDNGTRKRRNMADVRVLFSRHLDKDTIRQQKKIMARLGVPEASSISEATHFVTDTFVRTRNMLWAIASGKPVVTHLWLKSCGHACCYLNENNYLLRDTRKETEIGYSMPVSLAHAKQQPLLQGKRVLITPNTKPGWETLSSLVKAVHGKAIERINRSILNGNIPDDLIILSCEEDYEICLPLLQKGAAVYSSELLLNGIVVQRLEFSRYQIFEDKVKRTRSTIWVKKAGSKVVSTNRQN